MKKIAILQSNYIPWKGYFDLINMVDEFILYDDMQYTRRDWRNRNIIKTQHGLAWLTIPIEVKGKYFQKTNETKVKNLDWPKKHWQSILCNYAKSKYFSDYKDFFENIYLDFNETNLSKINYNFILAVNTVLGIQTKIRWSSEFELEEGRTEKILGICKQANATTYLSGPAAKDYFNEDLAKQANILVEWMDYSGYPEYGQLHPPFEHGVSVLDLIFNEGPNAKNFMKSFK